MTRPSFKMLACATASAAVLVFLTLPAFAGFEWRGSAPTAAPAPAAAPAQDGSLNGLEPVTSWDGSPTSMPAEKVIAVETEVVDATKPMPLTALPLTPPPAAAADTVASFTPPHEIVSGFGSDLPLAIALPQITPPGYQYAFAPGVDAGQSVSWDGGRGWKNVLADALKPSGLGYQVEGNTIKIMRASDISASTQVADSGMRTISVTPTAADMPESRIKPDAVAVPMGEPVTIRRQKPSLLASKNKKTTEVIVPTVPPADLAAAQLPVTAPAPVEESWDALPPPITDTGSTASQPVSLTSLPPAESVPVYAPAPVSEMVWDTPAPAAAAPLTAPPSRGLSAAESLSAEVASEPAPLSTPVPALPPQMTEADIAAEKEIAAPVQQSVSNAWHATRGETLREVMTDWARQAGVEIYWSIDYDYKVLKNFNSSPSFEDAVAQILEQFTTARPQPYGQLHQNSKGTKVLIIRSYDLVD